MVCWPVRGGLLTSLGQSPPSPMYLGVSEGPYNVQTKKNIFCSTSKFSNWNFVSLKTRFRILRIYDFVEHLKKINFCKTLKLTFPKEECIFWRIFTSSDRLAVATYYSGLGGPDHQHYLGCIEHFSTNSWQHSDSTRFCDLMLPRN